jgi:hypothetical protein
MKLNCKYARLAMAAGAILLLAGCGGLSASHSVSPASFFLPGLLKAEPVQPQQPNLTVPKSEPVKQLAKAQ